MSVGLRADPRLSARKAEVRRAAGRRRLRALLAVAALAALAGGALAVLHSPILAARSVTVTGAVHETTAEVLAVSGLDRHPPLIDLDPGRAAAEVESLPWVRSASVSRRWPDGATVAVVERQPLAEVPDGAGRYAVLDGSGRVLEVLGSKPTGLAPLGGLAGLPAPGGFLPAADAPLLAVARAVPVALLRRLDAVSFDGSGSAGSAGGSGNAGSAGGGGVELDLSGGTVVELGSATELRQKMVSLMTVLDRPKIPGISRIDLRVASAPVLTA